MVRELKGKIAAVSARSVGLLDDHHPMARWDGLMRRSVVGKLYDAIVDSRARVAYTQINN